MLSNIILGGITLPKPTEPPKLDYEEIELYSKPSVTGRLHIEYKTELVNPDLGVFNTVKFNRKFSFNITRLSKAQYDSLRAIDGTNCLLAFDREQYGEEYMGNLDMTFFKFDEHNYFDAVSVEFTVTSQLPVMPIQPTFTLVSEDLSISSSVGIIYYTYSASGTPADPTIASTLYTSTLISANDGNYKAISYKYGVYSSIKSYTKV